MLRWLWHLLFNRNKSHAYEIEIAGEDFEVNIYDGPEVYFECIAKMPQWKCDIWTMSWVIGEVGNGGFYQFFHNSTGVVAPEAIEGFRRSGLTEFGDTVAEAVTKFGENYPRDQEERFERMEELKKLSADYDIWDDQDTKFYAVMRRVNFRKEMDRYASENLSAPS